MGRIVGEGPRRRQEPRQSFDDLNADDLNAEAVKCGAARAYRAANRSHRSRNQSADRSRTRTCPKLRHSDNHPRNFANARAGNARTSKGRKSFWPCANCPPVRTLDQTRLHCRRTGAVRTGLSLPALVAARFNPGRKQKYAELSNAKKPAKVALTQRMLYQSIVAHNLIRKVCNFSGS